MLPADTVGIVVKYLKIEPLRWVILSPVAVQAVKLIYIDNCKILTCRQNIGSKAHVRKMLARFVDAEGFGLIDADLCAVKIIDFV